MYKQLRSDILYYITQIEDIEKQFSKTERKIIFELSFKTTSKSPQFQILHVVLLCYHYFHKIKTIDSPETQFKLFIKWCVLRIDKYPILFPFVQVNNICTCKVYLSVTNTSNHLVDTCIICIYMESRDSMVALWKYINSLLLNRTTALFTIG